MSRPVIAFDALKQRATSAADAAIGRLEPVQIDASEVKSADGEGTRAGLAAVYASLIGETVTARDLMESAQEISGESAPVLTLDLMGRVFAAQGLRARRVDSALEAQKWPALVEMTTGQIVLVLSGGEGRLVIYDDTASDHQSEVDISEFKQVFAGRALVLRTSLGRIARKYQGEMVAGHWFWGEFPKYRKYLLEIAGGSLVANLLAMAVALFSLQVYDRVIPHQSMATLWVLAIGAFGAVLMETLLKIARARLMDGAGRQIELGVQRTLMGRLLGMRAGQPDASPSVTFSAMRDFSSIREFFTASTVGSLTDIPFILLFLALVASIAGNVVWVLILGGVLMVLPGIFLQKKMIRITQESQGASVRANRLLHEAIYDADTLKAHRGEERFARLWDELTALSALKSSEQRRLASALTFWSQGIQQATYVAAVVVGTFMVFTGEFTVGSIIAVGILTSRTLAPLTQLAGMLARWSNVRTALDSLDKIATSAQDFDSSRSYMRAESVSGRFDLRDLGHRYNEDGNPVLDIPALTILPGQHVALLGVNGSGKSTLLKLLTGLYDCTQGRVQLDGMDMNQIHPRDMRRAIGYLGQEVRLFAGTLRDNLNLNQLERDDARLMEALDFAGLGPFVSAHPRGLDLEISDGGLGLSSGQRQSIGWARLWLQNPRIVLLDEPTAALDQTLEATLVSRMRHWLDGRTAVIATHRLPILDLCERVLILQNGKLAVDGPKDAVLDHMKAARMTRDQEGKQ